MTLRGKKNTTSLGLTATLDGNGDLQIGEGAAGALGGISNTAGLGGYVDSNGDLQFPSGTLGSKLNTDEAGGIASLDANGDLQIAASGNPLAGQTFHVDQTYNPAQTHSAGSVNAWSVSRPSDSQLMRKIAETAKAKWATGTSGAAVTTNMVDYLTAVGAADEMAVIVLYAITNRDARSGLSVGGLTAPNYKGLCDNLATAIGNKKAVVVVEPDALADLEVLTSPQQTERIELINYAVDALRTGPNCFVYIDAGNYTYQTSSTMITRLNQVGIERAEGFSLNVAGFAASQLNITYGNTVSLGVGGKHFVLDTARNGNGSYAGSLPHSPDINGLNGCPYEWANPPGRALGSRSGFDVPVEPNLDAYLWVKYPGESDGTCGYDTTTKVAYGAAGDWEAEYALRMCQNTGWSV